jgi:hypothetical protein
MIADDQGNKDPELLVDDRRFAVRGVDYAADFVTFAYQYRPAARRPFVSTLVGPSGRNLLECPPADHAHHLGLWWGHGDVNGVDFYLENEREDMEHGRIEHVAFEEIVDDSPWFGFDETLEWRGPDGEVMLTERRVVLLHLADDQWYTLDLDSTYTATVDITFGDTKESVLPGVRVAEQLVTYAGGTMTNSEGMVGENDCMGAPARWIDRSGQRRGLWHKEYVEGLAMFDHPENPYHPAKWFARDYGPLSPMPGHHFLGGGSLAVGASLRFRHRVLVHGGDVHDADVDGHYARWLDAEGEP